MQCTRRVSDRPDSGSLWMVCSVDADGRCLVDFSLDSQRWCVKRLVGKVWAFLSVSSATTIDASLVDVAALKIFKLLFRFAAGCPVESISERGVTRVIGGFV